MGRSIKNIVVWNRPAGIGDAVTLLGVAMVRFNEQPFEIVCGKVTECLEKYDAHYFEMYSQIFKAFELCVKYEFLNLNAYEDSHKVADELARDSRNNVLYIDDFGYKDLQKYIYPIREKFKKYFHLNCSAKINDYLSKDDINICFQIKTVKNSVEGQREIVSRFFPCEIDFQKWKDLIIYVAQHKRVNLIGIGRSEEDSPYYLPRKYFADLLVHQNIKLPYLDVGTSVIEDLSLLANCDLFIGSTGPYLIACMLDKPVLALELQNYPRYKRDFFQSSITQKIYWGKYSLDELKGIFDDYMQRVYPLILNTPEDRPKIYQKQCLKEIKLYLDTVLLKTGSDSKSILNEIYYLMAIDYLSAGCFLEAERLLGEISDYLRDDKYQFYSIGRSFKDGGELLLAKKYLERAAFWAKENNNKDILSASFFHLGEVEFDSGNHDRAKKCFEACLSIAENHKKASEYLYQLNVLA